MMQLYLIRHGETAGDPHRHYAPPVAGCLSARGAQQAEALAAALVDVPFDAIYASPLGRAIQTAQALSEPRGLDVQVLDWLIEWRPATVLGDANDADYERMMIDAAAMRPERCWKTPAGEGTLEMAHRVIVGFIEVMTGLGVHAGHGGYLLDDPDDDRRIAMVAHGGSLGRLLGFLLGVPLTPHPPLALAHTGVAVVSLVRRVDVWYPVLEIAAPAPQRCSARPNRGD